MPAALDLARDMARPAVRSMLLGSTALTRFGVNGVEAALALDFIASEYRTANTATTFAKAFMGNSPKLTYNPGSASSSQSTMVNSSGEIVWAPHNLLDYSEDFSQSLFQKDADVQVGTTNNDDPAGGNAATQINVSGSGRVYANTTAGDYFSSVYIKPGTFSNFKIAGFFIDLDATPATNSDPNGSIVALPDNWFRVTVKYTGNRPFQIQAYPDATYVSHTQSGDYQIWGAHLYRSDLGGMAPVPGAATGFETYVPTNGAAVYLPRVGHHVFNGSTWVNEGLLIESEARTNLSVGFASATGSTATPDSGVSPSGASDAIRLSKDATDPRYGVINTLHTVAANTTYTVSAYFKWDGHDMTTSLEYNSINHFDVAWRADFSVTASSISVSVTNSATATVEDVGNGWHRCSATFTTGASPTGVNPTILIQLTGGDGASLLAYGAQLEVGEAIPNTNPVQYKDAPTPSSYIPTNGSTVIRGGQSLTVPANWYDADNPTYTGPELVTNGGFDTDLSGWTDYSAGSASVAWNASGYIDLTGAADGRGQVYQAITTVVGGVYVLQAQVTDGTPYAILVGTSAGGNQLYSEPDSTGNKTVTFTATATTSYVALRSRQLAETVSLDNISVRQVSAPQFGWPEPEVIGPELVDNGGFDTDTVWTKGTGWTIEGGTAIHAAGSATLLTQSISMTLGKVYQATCDVVACSGGSGALQFRSGGTTTSATIDDTAVGSSVQVIYVAEGNTQVGVNAGAGTDLTIDNISVREINPLSVSFQMDGRMTYADEGVSGTVRYYLWETDGDNKVRLYLDTDGTKTGSPYPFQAAAGVFDGVVSGDNIYSPGTLVPFNISSRHGSTFINGAADGVALNANTTPTALPDLSNTNLEIAEDFMGTIGQFRQFAGDLGDTGLVTATNPSTEPTLSLTFDGTGGSFYNLNWSE